MGVIIERVAWEPNVLVYVFIVICVLLSLAVSRTPPSSPSSNFYGNGRHETNIAKGKSYFPFDFSSGAPLRFQRKFLLIYSLASVMEGMWSVIGEFEFDYFGISKEDMLASLCLGYAASFLLGTFLGVLSDFVGHRQICLLFCAIHLVVAAWKRIAGLPSILFTGVCFSLATSMFSCSFEAWLVVENEVQSYRHDALTETFLFMTFLESMILVGSQVLANGILGDNIERGMASFSTGAILLSAVSIYLIQGKKQVSWMKDVAGYRVSFIRLLQDKRVWLLGFSHSCLHFAVAVVCLLWAPTLVADGRDVNLGLVFPCFMGARMVGCTIFQWLCCSSSAPRTEDFLSYAFALAGFVLSIVAYDYQEIGVLVFLFCFFHLTVGLLFPSLARLRTMHVPNELRGGMISLSLAPAHAGMLILLIQRGYYQTVENSTMMTLATAALFVGAACMHFLKRFGKQLYQSNHKL